MQLRLILDYDLPISAQDFSDVFEILENQLWDAEFGVIRQLPESFGSDFPFINRDFVQACAARLNEERGKGLKSPLLQIDAVRMGSLIFEGTVVAIGLWIVKTTIGESFKEAYKNSDLHRRIIKFFLLRQHEVLEWAVDGLSHLLRARQSEAQVVKVEKLEPESGPHWLIVIVKIRKKRESVPTYSEMTDQFNKGLK